jgi:hypothetical protein
MKRFFFTAVAALALLVPTLTFAQGVKTVYRPEVHGTVVVVQPAPAAPVVKNVRPPLTPLEVIARHEPMASQHRAALRVNHSAAAHCDRLVAEARDTLRKAF